MPQVKCWMHGIVLVEVLWADALAIDWLKRGVDCGRGPPAEPELERPFCSALSSAGWRVGIERPPGRLCATVMPSGAMVLYVWRMCVGN